MTKVVCRTTFSFFDFIKITGHANFADSGKDIVCAGISSIVEGAASFFQTNFKKEIVVHKSHSTVSFMVNKNEKSLEACLQMIIHQLRNIAHFYPDYLSVSFE